MSSDDTNGRKKLLLKPLNNWIMPLLCMSALTDSATNMVKNQASDRIDRCTGREQKMLRDFETEHN